MVFKVQRVLASLRLKLVQVNFNYREWISTFVIAVIVLSLLRTFESGFSLTSDQKKKQEEKRSSLSKYAIQDEYGIAEEVNDPNIGVFSKDGAWCWFADPRAVYYEGIQIIREIGLDVIKYFQDQSTKEPMLDGSTAKATF